MCETRKGGKEEERNGGVRKGRQRPRDASKTGRRGGNGRESGGTRRRKRSPSLFPPPGGNHMLPGFMSSLPLPRLLLVPAPIVDPAGGPLACPWTVKARCFFLPFSPLLPKGRRRVLELPGSSTLPLLDDVLRASLGSPTVDPFVFLPGLCRRYARMFEIVPEHLSSPLVLSSTAEA